MRESVGFDDGWAFLRGDLPVPRNTAKTGATGGPTDLALSEGAEPPMPAHFRDVLGPDIAARMFNTAADVDPRWAPVLLPDDWTTRVAAEAPAEPVAGGLVDPASAAGYLPAGVAWYRKLFDVPAEWDGERVSLEFDGVMRDAHVWVNGSFIGSHYSGYTGFALDVTEFLRYGEEGRNVVLVRTDTSSTEGWWAEGAGIYRHVRLVVTGPVHIARHGIFVHTVRLDDDRAIVRVHTEIDNDDPRPVGDVTVESAVGVTAVATEAPVTVDAFGRTKVTVDVELDKPARWSPASPALVELVTVVRVGGDVVDRLTTTFGIRTIEYGFDGLYVNGELTEIRGACAHQDFAGVGIALPDRVHEHKIALLHGLGVNAYRPAAHPPAPEILDACDRLGLLVLDDNRRLETNADGLADLAELIRRDRNHPSVFMWCLENEEVVAQTAMGRRLLRRMVAVAGHLDPTRLSTAAGQFAKDDPEYMSIPPVAGFNYDRGNAAALREARPGALVMATEDASFVSTRGCYEDRPELGLCSSHDTGSFIERMARARGVEMEVGTIGGTSGVGRLTSTWEHLQEHPYLGGAFVWTGFDYRGEAVPFRWPAVTSSFGLMDLCGFPKDAYHYWRTRWSDDPVVHVLPHWSWPGREGGEVLVEVYTNCDSVDLDLNGRILGKHDVPARGVVSQPVIYEGGVLTAHAYRDGVIVATALRETTSAPAAVVLDTGTSTCMADGQDVAIVRAAIVDGAGRVVPTADTDLRFSVSAGAEILGTGNGCPADPTPAAAVSRRAFNGLALAIVRPPLTPGPFTVRVDAADLPSAELVIDAVAQASGSRKR